MKNQLLVTAIGEDRPGIVAKLTEIVAKHGGNLEASRMALLGGEFAAISLVTVPAAKMKELETALGALSKEGLTVICKETTGVSSERFAGHSFYKIALTGADHEGIVHKISAHLRDLNINFQSVDTDVTNAPVTGTPLFTLHATIAVPASISYEALSRDLATLADEEAVDIDLVSTAVLHGEMVRA
ncbi:MAG: glycine cleavage system protein R [Cyanobacteria bacterium SZAS TMP-1]|nr:glycine cleavage system protein R [Cyanobacteria bacterium SZAS TMP-1]